MMLAHVANRGVRELSTRYILAKTTRLDSAPGRGVKQRNRITRYSIGCALRELLFRDELYRIRNQYVKYDCIEIKLYGCIHF